MCVVVLVVVFAVERDGVVCFNVTFSFLFYFLVSPLFFLPCDVKMMC